MILWRIIAIIFALLMCISGAVQGTTDNDKKAKIAWISFWIFLVLHICSMILVYINESKQWP